MSHWQIPSSHTCIMRVTNTDTGKVTEHAYRKIGAARNKLIKLVEDPANEVVICDNDTIHLIKQQNTNYILFTSTMSVNLFVRRLKIFGWFNSNRYEDM